MKGLPLAYSKDMQEDKPPVFEAFDALDLALTAMTAMVAAIIPNTPRMAAAAGPASRPPLTWPTGWCAN